MTGDCFENARNTGVLLVILKARTIEVIVVVLSYLNFVIICQMFAGNTPMEDVKLGKSYYLPFCR
jgi:hypothetical protein